jgi:excisionase family DNA binding protein
VSTIERKTTVDRTELLTVPEAADRLRVSKWMLYNLIRSRRLRSVKIGDRRLVPVVALQEFLISLQEDAA